MILPCLLYICRGNREGAVHNLELRLAGRILGAMLFETPMTRKRIAVIASISAVLLAIVGMGIIRTSKDHPAPLGQARPIHFVPDEVTEAVRQQFIDRDFTIVKDVKALPSVILDALTEQGGSRLVIANPGEKFEATDLILDPSLPRRRLIFAGVSNDRCFIHYERGGRGHSYILVFFILDSTSATKPLWSGYCDGPAATMLQLRSNLANGHCSAPSNSL